jgi:hypothetical protein
MKPWYKSKTLIVNAFVAGLVAFEAVTGLLKPYMHESFYIVIAVALPIINAMLRVITTEPVRFREESRD